MMTSTILKEHWTSITYIFFIYRIHIFLSTDWLKVRHVIKNKLTILQKLGQSPK